MIDRNLPILQIARNLFIQYSAAVAAVGAALLHSQTAVAQIGATSAQFRARFSAGQPAKPIEPATTAETYRLAGGAVLEVGFEKDRAVYLIYSGRDFFPRSVNRLLAANFPSNSTKSRRGTGWRADKEQMAMYPPVGKRSIRSRFVLTGIRGYVLSRYLTRTRYEDSAGNVLPGTTRFRTSANLAPIITGVRKSYPARQAVSRVVLASRERRAYATFDLSFDTDTSRVPVTNRIFIAEAGPYWRWVLDWLADQRGNLPRPYRWSSTLTGRHIPYDQAVASLLPPNMMLQRIDRLRLLCAVRAIDNQHVSYQLILKPLLDLPKKPLTHALMTRLSKRILPAKLRRVRLLGDLKARQAVTALIRMLDDDRCAKSAAWALRQIAKSIANGSYEFGTDREAWTKWWRKAGRDLQRP